MRSLLSRILIASVAALLLAQPCATAGRERIEDRDQTPDWGGTFNSSTTNWYGAGEQILLRNTQNGRFWTTYFVADNGTQAYNGDTNDATYNAMSLNSVITSDTNGVLPTSMGTAVDWAVDAIFDCNGDGKHEVLMTMTEGTRTYKRVAFFADNGTVSSVGPVYRNGSKWVVEGAGEFISDNQSTPFNPDNDSQQLLLRNSQNGAFWITHFESGAMGTTLGNQAYNGAHTNAMDAYYLTTGDNAWSQNAIITSDTNGVLPTSMGNPVDWAVSAIGDINGDDKDEVMVTMTEGTPTYKRWVFFADNGNVSSVGPVYRNGSKWVVQGCGMFNTGNGTSGFNSDNDSQQVLMRNSENGSLWISFFEDGTGPGVVGDQAYSADNSLYTVTQNPYSALTSGSATDAQFSVGDPIDWVVSAIVDVNNDGQDEVIMTYTTDNSAQMRKKTLFFNDNGCGRVNSVSPEWQNNKKWAVEGRGRVAK